MIRFPHRLVALVALVVVVLFAGSLRADADTQKALIGKPAPEIPAGDVNINGKGMKLSEFKGKVVMLDFWAVWCGPCVATMPTLREWQDEYKDKGFVILGVTELEGKYGSFDKEKGRPVPMKNAPKDKEEEMLRGFVEYHKLNYQIVALNSDASGKVEKAYGVEGIPMAVLINRKGEVAMVKVGNSPENKKAIKAEIEKLLAE
jgi:thiol-disulfide isomerase/thioredoxin